MITLYGVPRSRTMRCLWMLEELGVPYENVPTHFATGDCKKPDYLKINPNGHIPALVDGDVTLFESLAINLYLARKYGGGLWPTSVADEGRAYQWSIWAMTEAEEPVLTALLHTIFLPADQRDPAKAEDGAKRFQKPLAVLDIDGNGVVDPLTDALLVLRSSFGFTAGTLVTGAVDLVGCTRCNAPTIEAYLATLK